MVVLAVNVKVQAVKVVAAWWAHMSAVKCHVRHKPGQNRQR